MKKEPLNLIFFKNLPILKQLLLEETLLQTSKENFFLFNEGTEDAIILGLLGKKEEFIKKDLFLKNPLPIIRRFSAGGCVVVGKETLFASFILNKKFFFFENPQKLQEYLEKIYEKVFSNFDFTLLENDYVIKEKKIAGNAQYLSVNASLHHSSFLWDFEKKKMDLLLLPQKQPFYRKNRSHDDFIQKLSSIFEKKEELFLRLYKVLDELFDLKIMTKEEIFSKKFPSHPVRTLLLK